MRGRLLIIAIWGHVPGLPQSLRLWAYARYRECIEVRICYSLRII